MNDLGHCAALVLAFCVRVVHALIAACFLDCIRVDLIFFVACAREVVFAGVASAVGSRTNQPYWPLFSLPALPVGRENRSLSNSGTV